MMNFISIIGVILTAIGTSVTLHQAYKVKNYSKAIRIDRLKMLLIDNLTATQLVKEKSKLLSASVNSIQARGFDIEKSIEIIENYLIQIKEICHRFDLTDIKLIHNDISNLLINYKKQKKSEEKSEIGFEIRRKLDSLIIELKKIAYDDLMNQ